MPQDTEAPRVTFEHPPPVQIMAIDGTWRRACVLMEVGESGATLKVEGSVEALNLTEFFLLLSTTGLAYRRCELSSVNGDQMGVNFLRRHKRKEEETGPADLLA